MRTGELVDHSVFLLQKESLFSTCQVNLYSSTHAQTQPTLWLETSSFLLSAHLLSHRHWEQTDTQHVNSPQVRLFFHLPSLASLFIHKPALDHPLTSTDRFPLKENVIISGPCAVISSIHSDLVVYDYAHLYNLLQKHKADFATHNRRKSPKHFMSVQVKGNYLVPHRQ